MDPGNIVFYTAPREEWATKRYRLPTEGLAEVAHCFNSMIIKDCVVGPTPGEAAHSERSSNPRGTPDVMVQVRFVCCCMRMLADRSLAACLIMIAQ